MEFQQKFDQFYEAEQCEELAELLGEITFNPDGYHASALELAAHLGNKPFLQSLINQGTNISIWALRKTCENEHKDCLLYLLSILKARSQLTSEFIQSILDSAAEHHEDTEFLSLVEEFGTPENYERACRVAVSYENKVAFDYLFPRIRSYDGPAVEAARNGCIFALEALFPHCTTEIHYELLLKAVIHAQIGAIKFLLRNHVKVSETHLYQAARYTTKLSPTSTPLSLSPIALSPNLSKQPKNQKMTMPVVTDSEQKLSLTLVRLLMARSSPEIKRKALALAMNYHNFRALENFVRCDTHQGFDIEAQARDLSCPDNVQRYVQILKVMVVPQTA